MINRAAAREAFKLALSMTLMFWLALWMNWDMPGNGGLAIILVSLGTAGASFTKGVLRIVGTTGGLIVGFVALGLFGQSPVGTLVFFSIYLVIIGYMMQSTDASYAWFVAGFLPVTVWASVFMSGDIGSAAFHYGSFRYLETTSGIVIYTMVSILIWPQRAGDQLPTQTVAVWRNIRGCFGNLRRLAGGDGDPDETGLAALQMKLAGALATMTATLHAAYGDSSGIRRRRREWEVLRINLRGLVDALELWGESVRDCRDARLTRWPTGLQAAMSGFDHRLERIEAMWAGADESPDGDAALLEPLELAGGTGLSHAEHAALGGILLQWDLLDRLSRELLLSSRRLAGHNLPVDPRPQPLVPDRSRRMLWNPQRLIKAMFPAVCFIIAYGCWIFFDPPAGPSLPSTVVALSLNYVLARMNTMAMMAVLLLGMWVCVAPVYFWVMPALGGGAGLLVMIFVYTFVFGVLGSKKPVLKLVPILLLVSVTGISNDQSYSFMALANGAMLFLLSFAIIAVVDMLWAPTRPENLFVGSLRGFFRGCAAIIDSFAPGKDGWTSRRSYFDSLVLGAPGELRAAAKHFDAKDFPGGDPDAVKSLINGVQAIILRLQAVEIAHRQLGTDDRPWREILGREGAELRDLLRGDALALARFDDSTDQQGRTSTLQRIVRELEPRLDAARENGTNGFDALHALLGSVRGLLSAMDATRHAMHRIDLNELAKAKF